MVPGLGLPPGLHPITEPDVTCTRNTAGARRRRDADGQHRTGETRSSPCLEGGFALRKHDLHEPVARGTSPCTRRAAQHVAKQRPSASGRTAQHGMARQPPRGCVGVPLKAPRSDRVMVLSAKVPNMTLSATRACCDGQSNLQPQRRLTCGACRRQCVCGKLPAIRRIRALRDVVHAYLVARRVRHQALHAYELGAVRRD
jgi:hypothetical protein